MTQYSIVAPDDYKRCVCDKHGQGEADCPQAEGTPDNNDNTDNNSNPDDNTDGGDNTPNPVPQPDPVWLTQQTLE